MIPGFNMPNQAHCHGGAFRPGPHLAMWSSRQDQQGPLGAKRGGRTTDGEPRPPFGATGQETWA